MIVTQVTCMLSRKKKDKTSTDLSSDAKVKSSDGELVVSEESQKDFKSEEEIILLNR